MPSYRTVEPEVEALLAQVIEEHHQDLKEAGVTVQVLQAHAKRDKHGVPKGPALKLHGYPCMAIVSIIGLKDRVGGGKDARIVIDGDRWGDGPAKEQFATLDHEMMHLTLVRDEEGPVVLDDACRPKLKMRLHDYELGIFEDIVKRHGKDCLDSQQYLPVHKFFVQQTFPWG